MLLVHNRCRSLTPPTLDPDQEGQTMSVCPNMGASRPGGNCCVQSMTAGLKRPQQRSWKKDTRFRTTPKLQRQADHIRDRAFTGRATRLCSAVFTQRQIQLTSWRSIKIHVNVDSLVWILPQRDGLSQFPLVVHQIHPLSCGQSQEGNLLRHKGNTSVTKTTASRDTAARRFGSNVS